MAIPFTIPNQEAPQPNIHEILRELCEILQQLLIICRHQQPIRDNHPIERNRVASDSIPELISSLSLLTVAFNSRNQDAATTPIANLRQRVRRFRTSSESSCCEDAKSTGHSNSTSNANKRAYEEWIEVGMELRKIAEEFKSTYKADETDEETDSPSPSSNPSPSKRDSIFSKFVPAPFTGSICTAVICVVGWHLLRNR